MHHLLRTQNKIYLCGFHLSGVYINYYNYFMVTSASM